MPIIDTHAHIYLPEFEIDLNEVIKRAADAGVDHIILPAIDSSTHERMINTSKNYLQCRSMIGLHPCSVNQDFKKEIDHLKEHLAKMKFVAIGEIGLDFYWDKTFVSFQYEAFHEQINIALSQQLPIAIHSRNATDECIDVIKQYPQLKGVFHCFSGNEQQAIEIIEAGFFLGIGGVLTFKNSGLDKVISKIGISKVVLETDAPYLAPVPYRGKRNEPSYTKMIVQKLSAILNISCNEVEQLTTTNAINLFNL